MREQSRLVTSLASEEANIDTRLKVANAAHRLIGDEAIQFIFQEMEDNLYCFISYKPISCVSYFKPCIYVSLFTF